MGEGDERTFALQGYHDMIPGDRDKPFTDTSSLSEGIADKGKLRASRGMIRLTVMDHDDEPGDGSQDGLTPADEPLRRLAG